MSDEWVPETRDTGPGLQRRVARGLSWTVVDIWGRQALNLLVFLVLARLLVPEDFGLVALAMVFVLFAQIIVDQGLGDALIQRREVTRGHIDTAFWVALANGSLLTVAGLLLAGPIARALNEPDLEPILRALSLTFVLAAMNSIQIALLRRELAFRSLAIRSLVAASGGGAVGVLLAYLGYGAWALVGQLLAVSILSVLTLWRVSPWRPSFRFSREHFRELFGFGINVMGTDVLNYLSRNMDSLLIGVFLGTTPLGFYAVAHRILEVSQTSLVQVTRKVTFPAFSRLQDDRERMRRAYFRVTRAASVVIVPGYIGLALVAPELIVTLFGAKWADSGPVARILFLIGPVLSVQAFSFALLNAAGHPNISLRFRFLTTVVNVAGFAIAVPFGIQAVAAAFVIRGYLLLPLNLYWMRVYGGIPALDYLFQLRGVALATLVMSAAVLAVKLVLGGELTQAPLLVVELVTAAVLLPLALYLIERRLLREVLEIIGQALPAAERAWRRIARSATPD
jgi:O-antigen/teichoic acid export membrane protein